MSDLDRGTRELLDIGRDGDDPSEHEIRANRRALAMRLGAATVLGAASAAGPGSAAAAIGGIKITALLASAALGGAVAAAGISVSSWRADPAPASFSAHVEASPRSTKAASAIPRTRDVPLELPAGVVSFDRSIGVAPEVAPSSGAVPKEDVVSPVPVPAVPVLRSSRGPSPAAEAPRAEAKTDLAASPAIAPPLRREADPELELVRAAEEDLHRGNPGRTLAALAEHERRFPDGMLWEEREVTRILALCQLGNAAAARAQAERFIVRAPASPFADRVREGCASPATKTP